MLGPTGRAADDWKGRRQSARVNRPEVADKALPLGPIGSGVHE